MDVNFVYPGFPRPHFAQEITGHFGLVYEENSVRETKEIREIKAAFSKYFPSTRNEKPVFSNSSELNSVFEKLSFRDGLV